MSYSKTIWVDEVLAGAERFNIKDNVGTPINTNVQVELATAVTTPGTSVNASNLNNIEQGIADLDTHLGALDTDNDNVAEHADLADSAPWGGITDKPTSFNPIVHTHPWSDVTGGPIYSETDFAPTFTNLTGTVSFASGHTIRIGSLNIVHIALMSTVGSLTFATNTYCNNLPVAANGAMNGIVQTYNASGGILINHGKVEANSQKAYTGSGSASANQYVTLMAIYFS
jgi:hypothetical protein